MRVVRSPSSVHRGGDELGGKHAESFDLLPIGTTIGGDVAGGRGGGRGGPYQAAGGGRDRDGVGQMDGGKNVRAAGGSGVEEQQWSLFIFYLFIFHLNSPVC